MEANVKKKSRFLLRSVVVLGTIATAVLSAACSCETSDENKGDEKKEEAGDISIAPVANAAEAESPVDATPSPDGNDIYFIAQARKADPDGLGFERVPAIFKVSAKGGALTKLHEGAPLGSPFNITITDSSLAMGPITHQAMFRLNFDMVPMSSRLDDVESPTTTWTSASDPNLNTGSTFRVFLSTATPHYWVGPNRS